MEYSLLKHEKIEYSILKKLIKSRLPIARLSAIKYLKHYKDEFTSIELRKFYYDYYGLKVGIGTYGCFNEGFTNFGAVESIGSYCSFASGIKCLPGNHPLKDVSTHPFFHKEQFGYFQEQHSHCEKNKRLIIGNDVWIGTNALIMPGCKKIGNGAVIGGGSRH